ncbi:ROK family protein [Alicyclobacillus kakegawensis]|uniref:ROK family protein n=1 Tax=Alicyclobacillus kakegawensis TaxID=392012 RepID=UPI00082BF20B|nr:ROK family protein [Alicyclobacillus kakegawensis]
MHECAVGVDIGATKIAAGLVDGSGRVLASQTVPTPEAGGEEAFHAVVQVVGQIKQHAQRHDLCIRGVGVGTAGQVDSKKGAVRSATINLPEWGGIPLAERIRAEVELPVRIDNDGNVALLAEVWAGAAQGHEHALGLTLGTGIGGGVVTGGRILHGTWGGAAELGHVCVNLGGPRCTCGSNGCMEVYASGRGMVERLQERLMARPGDASAAARAYVSKHGLDRVTAALVFAWARAGDKLACETLDEANAALAYGVTSLIHVFNPTVVVVGGGVVAANPSIVPELAERVHGLGMPSLVQAVSITAARFGAWSGVIGAAALILQDEAVYG